MARQIGEDVQTPDPKDERVGYETELSLRDWRDLITFLERQYQAGTANGREHHPHTLMLDRVLDALPDVRVIDELIAEANES